jgi:hypothetical protein
MSLERGREVGPLAIAVGVVGLGSFLLLVVYFLAGGPFGAVNDVGNGGLGVLSGGLAWLVWHHRPAGDARPGVLVTGLAVLGAVVAVVGSALILSDTAGFLLSGLVSSVGFAMIGVWVITLNRRIRSDTGQWPGGLVKLGVLAGAVMAVGLVDAPGVVMGVDDTNTAPWWILAGLLGWLGTYLLFPIWSIWFGRATTRSARTRHP